MYAGHHYTMRDILWWTRRESAVFLAISGAPVVLAWSGVHLPVVPWAPVAVLGTAVAFVTGFKSNAAYGRLWEARQIYGAIVNTSRTWAFSARDFLGEHATEGEVSRLVHRHIAWLTALRHQLRAPRAWETQSSAHNAEYQEANFSVLEHREKLPEVLASVLSEADLQGALSAKNPAFAILAQQSADLRRAAESGRLHVYRQVELQRLVADLMVQQGKCERIKNFPYPRQFATLNLIFIWLFIVMLPLALHGELAKVGSAWLTLPLGALMAWVFHTMDKIGEASENPFEGGPNDVPISAMSRGIEIDLRDMLGETDLPAPHVPVGNVLM